MWINKFGRDTICPMTRHPVTYLILIFVSLTSVAATATGQALVLGVLEDVPGVYAGEPNSRQVRVVFRKVGNEWEAFPSNCPDQSCLKTISSQYPNEVVWTVSFDGRRLGKVTGQTPKEFNYYSHVGLQQIKDSVTVPTVGKRSAEFGGFSEAAVFRPLVANSQPYFSDPESWKPAQPTAELIKLLREQFRQRFPKFCRNSKQDEGKLEPFLYRDEDVKLAKAYASNRGWTLARLHLRDAIDCEDVEAGFEINDKWFTVDPQRKVQYLDGGIWLVDAGDYDNDGKSELVFSIDDYNRGGYEIFYDNFRKHTTFKFSYH
jgi:hypothetical protein